MKTIAPPKPDFDSYITRADTQFIAREGGHLESLYDAGYLPYSSSKGVHDVFYSARSARVVLPEFAMTSENRRIARKFDGQFTKHRMPAHEFARGDEFYAFVLGYFARRHGANVMPRERLELLLSSGLISTVTEYRKGASVAGYVLEVESGAMRHYWYSAYDLSLAQQSLGLWLMLDCIRDAAAAGLAHYYLGTVYGPKALYKTNFEPLEWRDGSTWSRDLRLLKEKSRQE
jgi:arginyl-tRNA--protein-N-Asp/Glu arginylyltransferase